MSKNIPDEKLELLLKGLLKSAETDDPAVSEIADSPALWWSVQRRIAEQKAASRSPWPPVKTFLRALKYGVSAFAALGLIVGIVVFYPKSGSQETAAFRPVNVIEPAATPNNAVIADPALSVRKFERSTETHRRVVRTNASRVVSSVRSRAASPDLAATNTEIKSDFIALSFARDAESGQIVRVKVPSSMMVTLGLVATVEKPSALVDAEVIVGDDGLTRAIRFIR